VEFFGEGVSRMSLADRATLANMAPEYGATMGFFPVDEEAISYLRRTGRAESQVQLVERYYKEQGLFRSDDATPPEYSQTVGLDMGQVEPSLAGPKRPQDRISLADMKSAFETVLQAPISERGFGLDETAVNRTAIVSDNGSSSEIGHGAVVIAAITSCTNTSNPSVMLAAGMLAQNAVQRGLRVKPFVKTSLAPGSRVVSDYLDKAGLTESLQQLGFHTVGYGCTSCIGNSGPLPPPVAEAVQQGDLVASAVLSGNRNFEGRVNALVKANYLASPPLVVAYALAGRTDIDLNNEPLGQDEQGADVYLREIWPSRDQVQEVLDTALEPEMFVNRYQNAVDSNETWNQIAVSDEALYPWDAQSTYIQEPPFLTELTAELSPVQPIQQARVLALLGDSVTTDHISPAGAIAKTGPAGRYLVEQGVEPAHFNSFGSRRGNDRVMLRGTFANIRIRNQLAPGTEGGVTRHLPSGEEMSIYDAAMRYREEQVPLVVLAGAEYGTGSSRDWAAKGTHLLGVRAVMATSYERIHRSNLVGMGVLPLEMVDGQTVATLGLNGEEFYDIQGLDDQLQPLSTLTVVATGTDGTVTEFETRVRIDTPVEMDYYRNGGILQTVLRNLLAEEN
ncbi:MAG: aconitate hydratase AcnA, partial [Pirellulaceae bacterium]|nr:aconitate hydratase AcnA [Pirellulaceae bacterium]